MQPIRSKENPKIRLKHELAYMNVEVFVFHLFLFIIKYMQFIRL